MTALMAYTGKGIDGMGQYISIKKEEIEPEDFPGIDAYFESWLKAAHFNKE
jgi:hypothetical protein